MKESTQPQYYTFAAGDANNRSPTDDMSSKDKRAAKDSHSEGATVLSAASNFWNTITASGTAFLALPLAARSGGLVLFPFLILFFGAMTAYSSDLLVLGCSRTGATDYSSLVSATLGSRWALLTDVFQVVFLLGVAASIAEGIADTIAPVIPGSWNAGVTGSIAISLFMSITLPTIDSLAPFSQVSFVLVLVWLFYMSADSIALISHDFQAAQVPWWPASSAGLFEAASQATFSWLVIYNVLPIYNEMREPKREGWVLAMPLAVLVTAICFLVVGIFSTLAHPLSNQSIFVQYANGVFGKAQSICFAVGFTISMPLYQWTGTRSALSLIAMCSSKSADDPFLLEEHTDSENLLATGQASPLAGGTALTAAQFVWAALSLLLVFLIQKLDKVITIASAVTAVPLFLIFPSWAWANTKSEEADTGGWQSLIYSPTTARVATVFGLFVWLGCLYSLRYVA